jgi:ferritin
LGKLITDGHREPWTHIERENDMLKPKMQDAMNNQINAEMYSSYLYLSMAAYFESVNLRGMANWMRVQSQEETEHAMKFFEHIIERGGKVVLTAIKAPPTQWASPLAVFEESYKHECLISGLINDLADLAAAEKDHASAVFLQWFVNEQVEEEAAAGEIVQKLRMIGESKNGLFMMDHRLGQRKADAD